MMTRCISVPRSSLTCHGVPAEEAPGSPVSSLTRLRLPGPWNGRDQVGVTVVVVEFFSRLFGHGLPDGRLHHIVARHDLLEALVVVEGVQPEPVGHGEQILEGDLPLPRVCTRAEVLGEELREALVQTLDAILLQRDAHEGGDHAFGHGEDVMVVAPIVALVIILEDHVTVAYDQYALDGGEGFLHIVIDLGEALRVQSLLLGRRGSPTVRRPVVRSPCGGPARYGAQEERHDDEVPETAARVHGSHLLAFLCYEHILLLRGRAQITQTAYFWNLCVKK